MTAMVEWCGGNCPVQAEGTIDGKEFYFRARGEHWSMGIGGDVVDDPEWYKEEQWGDGPFAAGWMPKEEALRIIGECADEYLKQKERDHGKADSATDPRANA